jgi:hypothetical protein
MKRVLKWLFFSFIGLVCVVMVIEANKSPQEKAAESFERQQKEERLLAQARDNTRKELANLSSVTASQLASAYSDNTVAADQQYKGKKYKVTGVISDINTDLFGAPYLVLRGTNQFFGPQFGFSKADASQLASLKKGQQVTLICTGRGDVAKTPMSDDCLIP